MAWLWVKFSAVNFSATVFDSNDLSVIRGSSAQLLVIVDRVAEDLARLPGATLLYSAASECVLRLSYDAGKTTGERPRGHPQCMKRARWLELCETAAGRSAEVSFDEAARELHARIDEDARRSWPLEQTEKYLRFCWPKDEKAAPWTDSVKTVGDEINRCLSEIPSSRWFTFAWSSVDQSEVVAGARSQTGLRDILRMLDSRLRRTQLQQWSISRFVAGGADVEAETAFCAYTMKRQPALLEQDGRPISSSASERRCDGREIKTKLYVREIDHAVDALKKLGVDSADGRFARLAKAREALERQGVALAGSFQEMVDVPPEHLPPNVSNKLAVIYFDGNQFGNRRETAAVGRLNEAVEHYGRASRVLTANGGLLLADLLNWLLEREENWAWRHRSKGRELRFETLMFGGDEVCLVCPAWLGWSLVGKLLQIFAGMRVPFAPGSSDPGQKVTFAVGMAFAHHKSPIRDLREMASSLSDAAKSADNERSMVQVMALEGLDQAEMDPSTIRWRMFAGELVDDNPGAFALDGDRWEEITQEFSAISRDVGRSQLHRFYVDAENFAVTGEDGEADRVSNVLKLGSGHADTGKWAEYVKNRLSDFPDAWRHAASLCGESDLLAHGAADWPFIALHHVLSLADYVIDIPAAKSEAVEKDAA